MLFKKKLIVYWTSIGRATGGSKRGSAYVILPNDEPLFQGVKLLVAESRRHPALGKLPRSDIFYSIHKMIDG